MFAAIPALVLTCGAALVQLSGGSLDELWAEMQAAVQVFEAPVYGLVAEEQLVATVARGTGVWVRPYNTGEKPANEYTLQDVPDQGLLREGAVYIRPHRMPKRGACAYVKGRPKTNGGGAGFSTRITYMAYICCARHYGRSDRRG